MFSFYLAYNLFGSRFCHCGCQSLSLLSDPDDGLIIVDNNSRELCTRRMFEFEYVDSLTDPITN